MLPARLPTTLLARSLPGAIEEVPLPPQPQVAVGAIVQDTDGRLLVVRRGHPPAEGRWTLPGGRLEPGERLEEAVEREVSEETGLDVTTGELIGYLEVADDDHHFVILDFRAHTSDDDAQPRPGSDATEAAWMSRSQLRSVTTTNGLLEFLDEHGIELAD